MYCEIIIHMCNVVQIMFLCHYEDSICLSDKRVN